MNIRLQEGNTFGSLVVCPYGSLLALALAALNSVLELYAYFRWKGAINLNGTAAATHEMVQCQFWSFSMDSVYEKEHQNSALQIGELTVSVLHRIPVLFRVESI